MMRSLIREKQRGLGLFGSIFGGRFALNHNVSFHEVNGINGYDRKFGYHFSEGISTVGTTLENLCSKGTSRWSLLGKLERDLKEHKVDEAWETYKNFVRVYGFPDQLLFANLITESSYSSESKCLPATVLRVMLEKKSLPSLDMLQMVFLHLVKTGTGTYLASNILEEICYCLEDLNVGLTKPDVMIFNLVLAACVRFGASLKGQQIMELMPVVGVAADAHTAVIIARIHEMNAMRDELKKFKDSVDMIPVSLAHHYVQFYDCLLRLHFKFNDIDGASTLLLELSRYRYKRSARINELSKLLISIQNMLNLPYKSSSCSQVIEAFIYLGWLETAHDILEDLEAENYCVEEGSYSSLLTAYYNKKMLREAGLVRQIRKLGLALNISDSEDKKTSDLRVTSVSKSDLASIIQTMREDDAVPFSVHQFNSSIFFFIKAKMIEDARQTYRKMQKMKVKPNASSFFYLISGYSSVGMYREITILWGDIKRSMENQSSVYNRE
ncbi:hypothetical protein C2S51_031720 [Perilla frutescens var. frutescens]|nr:hypothetical protein C2S51_031720 [Perilla frutescens var. frutescens]